MTTVFEEECKGFPRKVPLMLLPEVGKDAAFGGHTLSEDILALNWTTLDRCNYHNSVFVTNPSSSDSLPTNSLKNIQKDNVDPGALVFIDSPDPKWVKFDDCVDMDCTGLLNFVFWDDGSVMGEQGQIVSSNTMAMAPDTRCDFNVEWNAYECPYTRYHVLHFESLDPDKMSRRVNPVKVEAFVNGEKSTNILNCFMDRRWDDSYTSLLRLSRFPVIVELQNEYNITFAGTNPRTLRFGFDGVESGDGVLINMIYQSPELHEVFINDEKVEESFSPVALSDENGAHYWLNLERRFSLVVKGTEKVIVKTIDAVQVSLTLRATVAEFYDNGGTEVFARNMAYTLGISMDRIRVVDVVQKPVRRRHLLATAESELSVEFFIQTEETTGDTESDEEKASQVAELQSIAEEVEQRAEDNTLFSAPPGEQEFAFRVEAVETHVSLPPPEPCIPSCKNITTHISWCDDGVCKCMEEGYSYHLSNETLLNDDPSGCYTDTPLENNPRVPDDQETPQDTPGAPGTPETPPQKKKKKLNVGALVGGLIGAVAVVVIAGAAFSFIKKKRDLPYSVGSQVAPSVFGRVEVQNNTEQRGLLTATPTAAAGAGNDLEAISTAVPEGQNKEWQN
ncbi:hypothetical protein BSKO_13289 [Bryopsis sp. KO-2023]|nr:hypothetical protein BSKO_13289 [Bryopsis sp. KO-2023]